MSRRPWDKDTSQIIREAEANGWTLRETKACGLLLWSDGTPSMCLHRTASDRFVLAQVRSRIRRIEANAQ